MIAPQNADLLSVGICVAGTLILGFTAYFSDKRSITNDTFFLFTVITAAWGILNYVSYKLGDFTLTLWALRGVLFLAVWQAFSLFQFFYVFPQREAPCKPWYTRALIPLIAIVSILTLTPAVFSSIRTTVQGIGGYVPSPIVGPGIAVFGITSVALVLAGLAILSRKIFRARPEDRAQHVLVLAGSLVMFALIIMFNFLFPVIFSDVRFIPLGALFTFPFVAFTAYAILQRGLFSVKVATTSTLVFLLAIVSVAEILLANSLELILFRVGIFALVLVFGINLIRSVIREVKLREKIEQQEKALEVANRQQEALLHFISHEVKGYLTKSEAGFAAIVEGDYGAVSDQLKTMATGALDEVRRGVTTVMDLLEASNLKSGAVMYKKLPLNFRTLVEKIVEEQRPAAYEKRLGLDVQIADGKYEMRGDEEKLREHVIRNLIDNAIKYTPSGTIRIKLTDGDHKIHFSVQDSGVGITPDDMARLFTEGGHGKNSIKVNVHSTGYGLFIAKQIVDAHGGKVWAESEGQGKGSVFFVEFSALDPLRK